MTAPNKAAPYRRALGLDPAVAISLADAVVFFIASAAVSLYTVQTLRSNNERAVHSHEAIASLGELLSNIQYAET